MQKKCIKFRRATRHDEQAVVVLVKTARRAPRDLMDLSPSFFFFLCRCRLLCATALIVRENNPFEQAGKTFRLSMDVMRQRRAARVTRIRRRCTRTKKHPKAFAQYLPSTVIALKVLYDLHELRAYLDRPRQDWQFLIGFIIKMKMLFLFVRRCSFFHSSAGIYFKF